MGKSKPILSISMLASDRLDTLPRCLDSLTPIREAIPCELIIVDTSNNPEVHELILKYADKTETFEWCNDFAKARNVGVNMAEGEWFMFIDDDEWFAEPEALIEFFRSGEYKEYGFAHHRIKNFHDPEFKTYGYGWVTRLTKMRPNTAFHSKVHEYLSPFEGESKTINVTIYHTGYIFKTKEEKNAHFERNASLLEKMEIEEPDELRWKIQMLQEYMTVSAWEKMADYGKKSLDYLWGTARKVHASSFATIHIGYAIALNECKQYSLVEGVYQKAKDVVKELLVSRAYMELCMAEAYWGMEQYEDAKVHAYNYIHEYETYCKNPSKYEGEILAIFLSDTFEDNKQARIYSILLSSELRAGKDNNLSAFYPHLMWNKDTMIGYCDVEVEILDCLIRKQDYAMLEKVLQDALSAQFIRPRMMKAVWDWKEKDAFQFSKLLEVIKTLDVQSWYKQYAALITLGEDATREEVLEMGEAFIGLMPNIFVIPKEVIDILEKYDIKLADLYLSLDFSMWRDALNERLEFLQMEQVEELKETLEDSALKNDVRFYYFMMIYAEQKALLASKNKFNFDQLTDLLAAFSEYTCLCYEGLYSEQLQAMKIEEWPKKYQAAKWLQVFFEEVGNDMKSALGCLAKVIVAYPRMSNVMQYYLERIQIEILNG